MKQLLSGSAIVLFSLTTLVPGKLQAQKAKALRGPVTINVNPANFLKVWYVSAEAKAHNGKGTQKAPFLTIKEALAKAAAGKKTAVLVAAGVYEENGLVLKEGTEIYGGYSADFRSRDNEKFVTSINGNKENRIMTLSGNNRVDGFFILKGQVRGKGGAVYTTAKNITLTNNIFFANETLKPTPWEPEYWHETANDGGAVYGGDGAVLTVNNNLFVANRTENGRGGGVAVDNKCSLTLRHNIFYNNIAGLDDPMRSSDGGAVSVFRWSKANIEDNIILSNAALAHNDAGGIWLALWSSGTIKNNILVDNEAGDDAGAIFIGGQEHRYNKPLDPLPPADKFFVSLTGNIIIGNKNPSFNSGAMRMTMESRGEFINNTTAFNNGIYFQRSEVLIAGNTILDKFLLIETKEGLKPCTVKDNIIWADYTQEVEAVVKNNNMLFSAPGNGNYSRDPGFIDDALQLLVASVNYFPKKYFTRFILLTQQYKNNELRDRVVRSGDKWGIIKSNHGSTIEVWGDLHGETTLTVLPTYSKAE